MVNAKLTIFFYFQQYTMRVKFVNFILGNTVLLHYSEKDSMICLRRHLYLFRYFLRNRQMKTKES